MWLQRVAVLHLEEKCERAIEWAMEIEPSVKHLVRKIQYYWCLTSVALISCMLYVAHDTFAVSFLVQVVSGGVASNQYVRSRLNKIVEKKGLQLVCPPPSLCTDNGSSLTLPHVVSFYATSRFDSSFLACIDLKIADTQFVFPFICDRHNDCLGRHRAFPHGKIRSSAACMWTGGCCGSSLLLC